VFDPRLPTGSQYSIDRVPELRLVRMDLRPGHYAQPHAQFQVDLRSPNNRLGDNAPGLTLAQTRDGELFQCDGAGADSVR